MNNNQPQANNAAYQQAIEKAKAQEIEIASLKAQLEAKKAGGKLEVVMSEFSSGTVSIRGLNRFPLSLHPEQWSKLRKVLESGTVDAFISTHANDLRIARVAADYAAKLGKKWPSGKSKADPEAVAYISAYNAGKALAMADPSLDITR